MNGTQKKAHEECIAFTAAWQKGTSQAEAMSNSEKSSPYP